MMQSLKSIFSTYQLSFFVMLLTMVVLSSCDVLGVIQFENKSETKATYRIYSITKELQDTTEINLEGRNGKNTSGIIFGFGHTWTDETIRNYVDSIQKIEILTATDTVVMRDKDSMFDYLKKRRKGLFKERINIVLR